MLTRSHLEALIEVAETRSLQGAAVKTGRSRATYNRYLRELREAFGAPELLRRAAGQREGVLTPEGERLVAQARLLLSRWDQWMAETRDLVSEAHRALRVGALPGAFDLIADLLLELRAADPRLPLKVVEYPEPSLLDAVAGGEVDLGFGNVTEPVPAPLHFEALGPLEWAVIVPDAMSRRFPAEVRLEDLDGVPLIVNQAGPARESIEREFAAHALRLNAVFEVGSTPRIVELVSRGFGVAMVSRFRTAFLPKGVRVRRLIGGPRPLTAGVYTRQSAQISVAGQRLVEAARARFRRLQK